MYACTLSRVDRSHLRKTGLLELYREDLEGGGLMDRCSPTAEAWPVQDFALATATDFYHYTCDGVDDAGWGCAYRAIETCMSSLTRKVPELADTPIPSIRELQERLAALNQIPESDVGSRRWLEPPDGAAFLESLYGIPCNSKEFKKCPETLVEFAGEMWEHFRTHKTAVMVDDALKAYAVGGIAIVGDSSSEESKVGEEDPMSTLARTKVLLLDPHHSGTITKEDFVGFRGRGARWVDFMTLFDNPARGKWMHIFPRPVVDTSLLVSVPTAAASDPATVPATRSD